MPMILWAVPQQDHIHNQSTLSQRHCDYQMQRLRHAYVHMKHPLRCKCNRDEHTWKYPSFTMTFLLLFLLTCQDRTIFRWKNSILIAVSSVHLVHCFMDKNKLNCETVELINCILLLDTCFMWIPQWVSYHLWYQRTPHTSHPDEQAPEHPEKKSREYS